MFKKLKLDGLDMMSLMNGLVFFAPVALLVRTSAGLSTATFFTLQALLSIVIFFFEIPAGKITDCIGYRKTIIISQILLCFARILLFVSFETGSLAVFVVEAFAEGIAICFSSGTRSAYLYTTMDEEQFVVKTAHISNCGTVGFIVSTVAYAGMYSLVGIQGLLIATVVSSGIGVVAALTIEAEGNRQVEDETVSSRHLRGKLCNKEVALFVLILSCISIGFILINFFYVEKIMELNLREELLTPIILGYSAIQLLSEKILDKIAKRRYVVAFSISFIIAGILMLLFGIVTNMVLIIAIMLVLPLCLDIPVILLDELQNKYVDEIEMGEKRAELLSFFNMGVNLFEIIFLFASAILSDLGISVCFLIIGVIIILMSILFYLTFGVKKKIV